MDDDLLTGEGGQEEGSAQAEQQANTFTIPEEYSDRGWVGLFKDKSGDDLKNELFKSLDNSQSLVGRKVEDYLKEADLKSLPNYEDIKAALLPQIAPEVQMPESVEGYKFNELFQDENGEQQYEMNQEITDRFGNNFLKRGVSIEQGQGLVKDYVDFELEEFAKHTNPEDLNKSLDEMFGNNKEEKNKCASILKEFLPPERQAYLEQYGLNDQIVTLYELAKAFSDKYDYKEDSGAGDRKGGNTPLTDDERQTQIKEIHKQLTELGTRQHTDEEKQALINKLVDLHK